MTSNELAHREPEPSAELARIRDEHTDGWVAVLQPIAELAAQVADTDFVPRALRNKPAAITAAVLFGRELDMAPMHALSNIHMVEGRPTLAAETMRAQVLAAGHEIGYGEVSSSKVQVKGRRSGETSWTVVEWTLADAQRAGLANKTNWKNYPRQMLTARATAELCRLIFPDVTHGMRATEELEDDGIGLATGGFVPAPAESTTKVARAQRGGKARAGATAAGSEGTVPVPAPPSGPPRSAPIEPPPPPAAPESPAPGMSGDGQGSAGKAPGETRPAEPTPGVSDEPIEGEPFVALDKWEQAKDAAGADASAPLDDRPRPIHSAQTKALQARFKGLGWTDEPDDRESRLMVASAIVGHDVDTFRAGDTPEHLSYDEAQEILRVLAPCTSRDDVIALMVRIAQDNTAETMREQG